MSSNPYSCNRYRNSPLNKYTNAELLHRMKVSEVRALREKALMRKLIQTYTAVVIVLALFYTAEIVVGHIYGVEACELLAFKIVSYILDAGFAVAVIWFFHELRLSTVNPHTLYLRPYTWKELVRSAFK